MKITVDLRSYCGGYKKELSLRGAAASIWAAAVRAGEAGCGIGGECSYRKQF